MNELTKRGLSVENVLLRDIQLPATLKASIEAKQQAEQEALAMNFRLQKETQEAQRKRIEAAGVRDFQQIVAQGITPSLLEWKGIEATENLAKSPNSKVVVDRQQQERPAADLGTVSESESHPSSCGDTRLWPSGGRKGDFFHRLLT